jgi:uncharacterized protein YpmS
MGGEARPMNKWAARFLVVLMLLGFTLVMTYLYRQLVSLQRQQQQQEQTETTATTTR